MPTFCDHARIVRLLTAASLLGLLTAGCGSDPTPPPACPTPGTMELGTGSDRFLPLAELDEVPIVRGPQGGVHITGAVKTCGVAAPIRIHYQIEHEASGMEVTDILYERQPQPDGRCCAVVLDLIGFLFAAGDTGLILDPSEMLDGEIVVMKMDIVDDDGVGSSDIRRVRARR